MGKSINRFELRDADVVLRPLLSGVGSADFTARLRSIQAGRDSALKAMTELRAKLAAAARLP
jgi:NTE family protein